VGLTHEKQSTPGKAIALAAIVEAGMWTQSGAAAQCRTRRQRPHVESALFDLRPPTSAADWTCVGSGIHTQQLSPGKLVTGSFRVLAERQMRQNEGKATVRVEGATIVLFLEYTLTHGHMRFDN
jgi:hypothetical protein